MVIQVQWIIYWSLYIIFEYKNQFGQNNQAKFSKNSISLQNVTIQINSHEAVSGYIILPEASYSAKPGAATRLLTLNKLRQSGVYFYKLATGSFIIK